MIVPIAALSHHRAHIAPVAALMGLDTRMARVTAGPDDVALIASYGDLAIARRGGFRRIILMQHGAGQSYGGDRRTARHPCYAGGDDNADVGLFLTPNDHSANRWRERYPSASVEVVGCPRLDFLPQRRVHTAAAGVEKASPPVVAVSFHWNYHGIPEMRSAFDWYSKAVVELSKEVTVIGHGHPKRRDLPAWYRDNGIEYVRDFDDVLRRADVYACDNSSTLFEFASTGRNVIVLEAPWYRKDANHGLRFWDAAGVGISIDDPKQFGDTIHVLTYFLPRARKAYRDFLIESREEALDLVYAYRTGAAQRAADAIAAWAGIEVAA